jgi:hypothetical protein
MPNWHARTLLLAIVSLCAIALAGGVYLYRSHYTPPAGEFPDLVSKLPAGAPAIAYINVSDLRKLKDSQLASLLGMATSGPQTDQEYQDFVYNTGFDYARDLDQVALAFWPPTSKTDSEANSPASLPSHSKDGDTLAVAYGRFDQQKIQAYALRTGAVAVNGKRSFYRVPGDPPVVFEFLSATRVALASGPNAEGRLFSMDSPGLNPALQALVNHVGGSPFFAVARADAISPTIYASLGKSPEVSAMMKSIQGLTLAGQPSANNIDLTLDAECDSMTSALQVSTLLDGLRIFGSLAISDPKAKSRMTKEQAKLAEELLAQVKIHQQENWVRISLSVSPALLSGTNSAR